MFWLRVSRQLYLDESFIRIMEWCAQHFNESFSPILPPSALHNQFLKVQNDIPQGFVANYANEQNIQIRRNLFPATIH